MSENNVTTPDDIIDAFLEMFDVLADTLDESIEKIIEGSSEGEVNMNEVSEVIAKSLSTLGITLKTGESIQRENISDMIEPLVSVIKNQFKEAVDIITSMKDENAETTNEIEKKVEEIIPTVTNGLMELVQKAASVFDINIKNIMAQIYKVIEEEK